MAIVKAINSHSTSHAAMRNVINYVLKESKTDKGTCLVIGPYFEPDVLPDKVYQNFLQTKREWKKDSGRMYKHFVISWHEDESLNPDQALAIGNEWVQKIFPEYTSVLAVHMDRNHLHCHVVVNSVSNVDGHKLHLSNADLDHMKTVSDEICSSYGLGVVEKGKHFDGTPIEEGTIRGYDKKAYRAIAMSEKKSGVADIMTKVLEASSTATSQESFVAEMAEKGITVNWTEKRKYITFTDDESGIKVRDKKLSQTFSTDISKETLENAFIRNQRVQAERTAVTGSQDRGCAVLETKISGSSEGEGAATDPAENRGIIGSAAKCIEQFGKEITQAGGELEKRLRHLVRSERTSEKYAHRYGTECGSATMTLRYVPYDICESAEKLERIYFHLISIEEHRLECLRLQHRKDWFKNQAAEREMELGQAVGKYIEELQKVSFEDLQMVSQARILIRKKEHPYSILSSKDRANPDLEIQAIMNVEEKVKQASREHEKTKEAQQMQEYTVPQRNQHRHR